MENSTIDIATIFNFLTEQTPIAELPPVDAIFVFGHIDKSVAEHAGRLYSAGKSKRIIVTGGIGTAGRDPSGFPSEAAFFASVMESMSVPREVIITEDTATNTLENVLFGMKKVRELGIEIKSVILVSVPFLLCRSNATFSKYYSNIKTYRSSFDTEPILATNTDAIKRLLAEIDRLDMYADKGDILKVVMPESVRESYKSLSSIYK